MDYLFNRKNSTEKNVHSSYRILKTKQNKKPELRYNRNEFQSGHPLIIISVFDERNLKPEDARLCRRRGMLIVPRNIRVLQTRNKWVDYQPYLLKNSNFVGLERGASSFFFASGYLRNKKVFWNKALFIYSYGVNLNIVTINIIKPTLYTSWIYGYKV